MRQEILLDSVRRRLPGDETLIDAAYLWHRHHLMVPYCVAAAAGMVVVALLVGFSWGSGVVAVAVAGATVAAMATTDYRVLALTDRGLVSFAGSRMRQSATGEPDRLARETTVELVGNRFVFSEWEIDGVRWSVTKRGEAAVTRMASR